MRRIFKITRRLAVAAILVTVLAPFVGAQENTSDTPLGDLARSFRKKAPSSQEVIGNDNLLQVMGEVQSRRAAGSSLLYSLTGEAKTFQVSAPDVSCSLSFSANTKALLSNQYAQLELPMTELNKLDGPAVIDGDSIQVSLFNGTDWHVSELEVAVTIVKRAVAAEVEAYYGETNLVPAAVNGSFQKAENPTEKRSDVTVVYRMRAAAPPFEVAVFRAPLNLNIGVGKEWHWAIVQAKGYPPQGSSEQKPPATETPAALAPASAISPIQNGRQGVTAEPPQQESKPTLP